MKDADTAGTALCRARFLHKVNALKYGTAGPCRGQGKNG